MLYLNRVNVNKVMWKIFYAREYCWSLWLIFSEKLGLIHMIIKITRWKSRFTYETHNKHRKSSSYRTETDSIVCCTDLLTSWFIDLLKMVCYDNNQGFAMNSYVLEVDNKKSGFEINEQHVFIVYWVYLWVPYSNRFAVKFIWINVMVYMKRKWTLKMWIKWH